jgi:hypothetical protein
VKLFKRDGQADAKRGGVSAAKVPDVKKDVGRRLRAADEAKAALAVPADDRTLLLHAVRCWAMAGCMDGSLAASRAARRRAACELACQGQILRIFRIFVPN